jgi:surface antigen
MKSLFLAATASLALCTGAMAQVGPGPNDDPNGYYSQSDHDGYYDRDGHYQHFGNPGGGDQSGPPPPQQESGPPPGYYEEGQYEDSCRRGNTTAGTLFGALAGGLIGSAASHGNGGAVAGGAILGGLFGNAASRDMDCEDHPYAFRVYADGLNGDLNHRYEWHRGSDYGYFTPMREYQRGGYVCRDFTETTFHHDHQFDRSGTACRWRDGEWHFD